MALSKQDIGKIIRIFDVCFQSIDTRFDDFEIKMGHRFDKFYTKFDSRCGVIEKKINRLVGIKRKRNRALTHKIELIDRRVKKLESRAI